MSYIDLIKDKARQDKKTIVLPETNDKRTLIATVQILEEGIANAGGGVGLYEHRLSITSNDPNVQGRNIDVYVNVITASSTPIADYTTLINTLLGAGSTMSVYPCSGQVGDYGDYSGRPTFYLATRFQVHQNNFDGNIQNTIQIAFASYTDMGIQENQCTLGEERFWARDSVRQIC